MVFANNIRNLRIQKGWSQEDLANRLGYKSFSTIAKWESGVTEPPLKKIKEMSTLFNVQVADLINDDLIADTELPEDTGHYLDPEAAELAQEMYDRPELRTLFSATRNVSKEDLEVVQQIVDRIAKAKNGPDDDPA